MPGVPGSGCYIQVNSQGILKADSESSQMRDKIVLITGPARGLGELTARALAAKGARLALLGLEPELLEKLARELGGAFWREVDVSDREAMHRAVEAAAHHYGRLDVVVANAGIGEFGMLSTVDPDFFEKVLRVNLLGTWHAMRSSLPHLIRSDGYFISVASLAAVLPLPGLNAYSASKAGQEALTETLRLEVSHLKMKVGVAFFSFMDTDLVRRGQQTPGLKAILQGLPSRVRTIHPASLAVNALVRGIEKRSARIVAPGSLGPLLWLRGLVVPCLPYQVRKFMKAL